MTNLTQLFAHVEDGEIKAYNIRRGQKHNGSSLGKDSPDEDYIAKGLYPIAGSAPTDYDRFTHEVVGPSYEIGENEVRKVYALMEKSLNRLKEETTQKVRDKFEAVAQRPTVDTGLGFSVQGGYEDLQDFETAVALGLTFVRDADNNTQTVTTEQMSQIVQKIRMNGLAIKQNKWKLLDEVNSATSASQLSSIDIESGWGEVNA